MGRLAPSAALTTDAAAAKAATRTDDVCIFPMGLPYFVISLGSGASQVEVEVWMGRYLAP